MNISHENTSNLTATIKIEVEKIDYSEKVEKKLKEYAKKAKMPGFREGKVPKGLVNKMYGKSIIVEEVNQLVSESLQNYVKQNDIQVLLSPIPNKEKQEPVDLINQDKFDFYFDIALEPDIDLNFEKIANIKKYNVIPGEEEINDAVKAEQSRHGSFKSMDVIGEEDYVRCVFIELNKNKEPLKDGINVESSFLVSKIADNEIKEEFTGKPADTKIILNPLKAFENKTDIAAMLKIKSEDIGETMNDFEVIVESIGRFMPAEPDKDLFSKVFPGEEIETEEQFKDAIVKNLTAAMGRQSDRKVIDDVFDFIIESNNIELPEDFIKRFLIESDNSGKTTQEEIERYFDGYLLNIKQILVKDKIVKENDLEIKEEDYYHFFDKIINKSNEKRELVAEEKAKLSQFISTIMNDEKQAEYVRSSILEDKLSELFNEKASFEEVSISAKEFNEKFSDTVSK